MNTNIYLTELGHAKATLCKPMSIFSNIISKLEYAKKYFLSKKLYR